MILSSEFIRLFRRLKLIYIEPFNLAQLNPNSYDVRLGNKFITPYWHYDLDSRKHDAVFDKRDWRHYEDGEQVCIGPWTLLGMTKERIGSRFCIVPELRGKSTTRRKMITVCDDAGVGDIGYYDNHWTVEIEGHSRYGDPHLTVGEPFAQVIFYLSTPTLKPYRGQYTQNDWPACMIPKKYRGQK